MKDLRTFCDSNSLEDIISNASAEIRFILENFLNNVQPSLNDIEIEHFTVEKLKERGLIKSILLPVKILGDGDINKKIIVEANAFSKSAKRKIEKSGGSCKLQ